MEKMKFCLWFEVSSYRMRNCT